MIIICRNKNTGLICKVIQLSNENCTQKKIDELNLTDKYYVDYLVNDIENNQNE